MNEEKKPKSNKGTHYWILKCETKHKEIEMKTKQHVQISVASKRLWNGQILIAIECTRHACAHSSTARIMAFEKKATDPSNHAVLVTSYCDQTVAKCHSSNFKIFVRLFLSWKITSDNNKLASRAHTASKIIAETMDKCVYCVYDYTRDNHNWSITQRTYALCAKIHLMYVAVDAHTLHEKICTKLCIDARIASN